MTVEHRDNANNMGKAEENIEKGNKVREEQRDKDGETISPVTSMTG